MSSDSSPETTPDTPRAPSSLALSSMVTLGILATLPAIFATGFSSYTFLRHDVLLATSGLALAIWGVEALRTRTFHKGSLATLAPLFGLALWALTSSFWSPNLLNGALDSGLLLALAALSIPIAFPVRRPLSWQALMGAASVGTIVAGLFGVLDAAGVGVFGQVFDAPGPAGSFDAAEFGTAYYVVALPLAAALIGYRSSSKLLPALGALATIFGGIHLAMINTSWLALIALAIGLIVPAATLMIHADKTRRSLTLPSLVAGAVMLIAAGIGPAQFSPEDAKTASYYNPAVALPVVATHNVLMSPDTLSKQAPRDARFALRRIESVQDDEAKDYLHALTLKAAKDRPLIGLGAGGWWLSQSRFVELGHPFLKKRFDHYPAFRSTHQSYAKVFIEYGVLGLILLAATLFAAIAAFSAPLRSSSPTTKGDDQTAVDAHALWGFGAALLAGAILMAGFPVIELAAPMAIMATALAALAMMVAHTTPSSSAPAQRSLFAPLVAVLTAAALLVSGALTLTSDYMQGKADQFMLYGFYEKARTEYAKAHDFLPIYGEVAYNKALAAWRTGELQDEAETLEEAIALRPNDARFHHLRASMILNQKDFKGNIVGEQAAISRFPTYIEAYENLIVAYDMSMQFQEATSMIEDLLALDPPFQTRVKLHVRAGDLYGGPANNPAKAIEHYDKVLPMLESKQLIDQIRVKRDEIQKQLQRDKLLREGKSIPSELLPDQQHDHNHVEDMLMPPGLPKIKKQHDHHEGDGHAH